MAARPTSDTIIAEDGARRLARLRRLGDLLDNAFRVPGTGIRVGLDPLIGLVPGAGDLAGAAISAYIIIEAARAGAPRSVLLRMLANVGIDTLGGSVPIVGDVFDAAWKSNAMNVRLLQRHLEAPREAKRASALLVVGVVLAVLLLAAAGIAITVLAIRALVRR